MSEHLDEDRITELVVAILEPIRDNYKRGPISRDRAYEALNALAAAVSLVIKGADGRDGEAQEFFNKSLNLQLKEEGIP